MHFQKELIFKSELQEQLFNLLNNLVAEQFLNNTKSYPTTIFEVLRQFWENFAEIIGYVGGISKTLPFLYQRTLFLDFEIYENYFPRLTSHGSS